MHACLRRLLVDIYCLDAIDATDSADIWCKPGQKVFRVKKKTSFVKFDRLILNPYTLRYHKLTETCTFAITLGQAVKSHKVMHIVNMSTSTHLHSTQNKIFTL